MECSSTTIPKALFPYAIVHYTVEYADVQQNRADARGVQQDDIHETDHKCKHSYNSSPRCTRSYSTKERMLV